MNVEWDGRLGQECVVNVLITDPDDLAGFVIECPENVSHIRNLTALIGELACEGRVRRGIQLLIFNLNDWIGRCGHEC